MAKTKIHGEYLDPSVISGQTEVTAVGSDHMLIFDATDNALKKALLSDLIETVGSTPTFSQISSTGNLTIDAAGDIILDADGDDWKFHEGGTAVFEIKHESHGVDFLLNTGNEDWRFKGSDDGTTITALHLDISEGGKAIFNAGAAFGSDVGIGTTSPQSGLHIAEGGSGSDGGSVLTLSQTGFGSIVNNDDLGSVHFGGVTGGGVGIHKSAIIMAEGDATWANNDYPTRLTFHTTADGASSATEAMRIDANGNVGIGTTTPSQKLHVDGEIKATSADITDGSGNTSIGYGALNNLTSGDSNVALGYEALEDVNSGIHNVGLGYRAGMNITTGQYNVAVGNYALSTNTTGGWNTCIGYGAGNTMSGNDHNTCIGRNAGYNITSGGSNTIIGSQAGDAQTSAHNNTFVGTRAGTSATTGNGYNTAIGVDALEDCTTGSFNVSLGTNTIKNVTTGHNNIGVGYRAGNAGQPGGQITSQSNIACIGDTAISSFNCQVSLSVASDERDKTDFTALDLGLDFVKSLQPYTFRWDKRSSYVDWDKNPDTDLLTVTHDGTHKEAQLDIGFKAQDVEKLEKSAGYNRTSKTNLTYALSPDGKTYSMKYEKLVPVLVKAIQELEAKVAELESK